MVVFSISVTSFAQENTKGNEEIKEDSAVETLQEEEPLEEAQTEENKETSTVKEEDPKKEAPKEEQPKEEPKKEDPQPKEAEKSKEKEEVKEVEKTKEKEEPKKEKESKSEETPKEEPSEKPKEEKVKEEPGSKKELAESTPPMLGEPKITLPAFYFQKARRSVLSTPSLSDTIAVDKNAERTDGCRTYEVTLDITGTPQNAPVDVVLVLDRSGSMNDGEVTEYVVITSSPSTNKSYYAKVNGDYKEIHHGYWYGFFQYYNGWYYEEGGNKKHVSWVSNGDDNSPGNNSRNNPIGKPFYERHGRSRLYFAKQAAVNFAGRVLGSNGIPGSRVSVVSFNGPQYTDGYGNQNQATTNQGLTSSLSQVTTAINNLNAERGTNTQAGFLEGKSVIQNTANPNSSKVVIMFTDGMPTASNGNLYGPNYPTSHNDHTIAAYTAGQSIYQNNIADVFTIGLLQDMSGSVKTLAIETLTIAQNKGFFEAPTAQDLDQIFTDISTQLGYSAINAVVKDKIGDNFDLILGSLPAGATYSPDTKEITWTPGTIVESGQLKYKVRAKSSFSGGPANTNEYATLTYTDVNGNAGQTKNFPVPQVDVAVPLSVSLTDASITLGDSINLGAGTNPSEENYMSPITGGDGNGNYTYEWRILEDSNIISTDENPTVSPTQDTEYELTVIDSNGCKAIATMKVIVEDPKGTITIKKMVQSPKPEDANKEFDIFVNGPNGTEYVVTLKNGESVTLENLEIGTYTISEIVPMNYKLVGITNSSISLSLNNLDGSSTVTNKPDNDGWFYDDDPLVNKFKVGILTQ